MRKKVDFFPNRSRRSKENLHFDPFLKKSDKLKNHELEKYDFFIFLSKGSKFKNIANLLDNKRIIDPFFYYTN